MASITLRNLTKTFEDGFTAVDCLNLNIADGEFVVFVGPSGCGKSTTLRMIAGLETVSSGSILIDDREVNKVAPKDRDIAMVFQNYALYPHLTVADNMGFALRMNKVPKEQRQQQVQEAARMLGLEDILNKKPGQLSGGQRQRVALGRAVVRKPSVFLFDEPLSNLDPDRRAATRAEIRRIQRELGITTVYVTHDHEEAMAMGDQIVILNDGILQQAGTPKDVFANPVNQFVGTFLGSPKMNILPGTFINSSQTQEQSFNIEICSDAQRLIIPVAQSKIDKSTLAQMKEVPNVSVGIRPHCIELADDTDSHEHIIQGRIIDIEQLGFATDLQIAFGEHTLLARCRENYALQIDQLTDFSIDVNQINVFVDNSNT